MHRKWALFPAWLFLRLFFVLFYSQYTDIPFPPPPPLLLLLLLSRVIPLKLNPFGILLIFVFEWISDLLRSLLVQSDKTIWIYSNILAPDTVWYYIIAFLTVYLFSAKSGFIHATSREDIETYLNKVRHGRLGKRRRRRRRTRRRWKDKALNNPLPFFLNPTLLSPLFFFGDPRSKPRSPASAPAKRPRSTSFRPLTKSGGPGDC